MVAEPRGITPAAAVRQVGVTSTSSILLRTAVQLNQAMSVPEAGQCRRQFVCSTENVVTLRDPDKEARFTNEFEDWHWQHDDRGLRLAQIRFYPPG